MKITTVYYCTNQARPPHEKVALISVDVPPAVANNQELLESELRRRLMEFTGGPPAGYSSWMPTGQYLRQ